jgi:hypothetical protein
VGAGFGYSGNKEFFIIVAAYSDQLKIIIWMINNYPSVRDLMEESDVYICHSTTTGKIVNSRMV